MNLTIDPTVVASRIRSLIEQGIEPGEPQESILAFLQAMDRKKITNIHLRRMRDRIDTSIRLRKQAGMTCIEWGGYGQTEGIKGGSLLLAYTTVNVTVDANFVLNQNPAYYSASVLRNAVRQAHLEPSSSHQIDRLASAICNYRNARAALSEAMKPFDGTDEFAIQKEFALKE